jgi:hypothetical protein
MSKPVIDIHSAYDPKVRGELVIQLAAPARIWGQGDAPHMPKSYPHYERDIRDALDYAGQFLDGYVMARFLEEHRNWPADQDLVMILGMAKELIKIIIAGEKQKSEEEAESFSVGDKFVDVFSVIYEIENAIVNHYDHTLNEYLIVNLSTKQRFNVQHKSFLSDIRSGFIKRAT